MVRYLANRLLQMVLAILAVATMVFFVARLSGDPLSVIMPIGATTADFERMAQVLGLDQPLIVQYFKYLVNIAQGDFGQASMRPGRDALSVVLEHVPATLRLGAVSLAGAILLGVPLGMASAVYRGRSIDFVARGFAALGQALPAFWVGIVLMWLFSVRLGWLPTSGRGDWRNMVMPSLTMGLYPFAAVVRLMRASMLEVMAKPFMLLLESKGLNRFSIIAKHAFKNAAAVPLTYFGITIGVVLTGSVVVESVFSWPGLGRLAIDAVLSRDFATTQAVVMVMAVIYLSANFIVDFLYGVVDPRVRADSRP